IDAGRRPQRGKVRSCVRLREALTPDYRSVEDPRQVPRLLLVGAAQHQRVTDLVEAGGEYRLVRRACPGELLVPDHLFQSAQPPPAVLNGPVDPGPTRGVLQSLP